MPSPEPEPDPAARVHYDCPGGRFCVALPGWSTRTLTKVQELCRPCNTCGRAACRLGVGSEGDYYQPGQGDGHNIPDCSASEFTSR